MYSAPRGGGGDFGSGGRGLRVLRQQDEFLAFDTGIERVPGAADPGRLADALKARLRALAAGQPADADLGRLRQGDEAFPAGFGLASEPLAKGGRRDARRSRQAIRARPMAQDRVQAGDESRLICTAAVTATVIAFAGR